MRRAIIVILMLVVSWSDHLVEAQQQTGIDSLVNLMRTAGREWNNYANPLIKIGEPAVPALIDVAQDTSLTQWNRRITVMTLNQIHSPLWIKPAKEILFNRNEDPVLRNQVTAGLSGFDLTENSDDLWQLFKEETNEFHKSNLAHLLINADAELAYHAFKELYSTTDGHVQKSALLNLVQLRPEESTNWLLDGLQLNDWMTSNLAMDSLVSSVHFEGDQLFAIYNDPESCEEVKWRIVYVWGHRQEDQSIPFLIKALQDESWLVHTEAAIGLSQLNPMMVIPGLNGLQDDQPLYIQNNVRWILNQFKNQ